MSQSALTTAQESLPSVRGLSLQVPSKESSSPTVRSSLNRVPLSPKLDSASTYGSPASVIPRRSRGLDFSRSCTNLHHSTRAEQSSPDSSPILTGRRGTRQSWYAQSPPNSSGNLLGPALGSLERTGGTSAAGNVNMIDSDTDSSDQDEDEEIMDRAASEDPILTTPQPQNLFRRSVSIDAHSSVVNATSGSPGGEWMGAYSPAARSLMNFRRAMTGRRRNRKSSSSTAASGSGLNTKVYPLSTTATRADDTRITSINKDQSDDCYRPRRGSLTTGTMDLQLSSGGESDEAKVLSAANSRDSTHPASSSSSMVEEKRGVVKRAVTRRGNLLPKSKNFARIRAALMEEGSPIDTEVKREAEVVRQVRENDGQCYTKHENCPATDTEVPITIATAPNLSDILGSMDEDEMIRGDSLPSEQGKYQQHDFNLQAKRLSGGKEFWESFDIRTRTPPPQLLPRASSMAVSDDMTMDSPSALTPISTQSVHALFQEHLKSSTSSDSSAQQPVPQPSTEDISLRIRRKRGRDDDLDPTSLKRRAVSPSVSVQNSPVLTESPSFRDGGWWGLSTGGRDGPSAANGRYGGAERTNSVASSASSSMKRVCFHGMNDAHEGINKMSIE